VCVCEALYIFKGLRLTVSFLAVIFCTTELSSQIFYILPRDCIYVPYPTCISAQTATFAICSINLLVLITWMESVYCTVRTGSFNKADHVSSLEG
jgi:hypothetical protein